MTQAEIQALAAGNRAAVGTSVSNPPTIIVQNSQGPDGCVTCDDAFCDVVPSTAVAIDLGAFKYTQAAKIRFSVGNTGGSAVLIPFAANWRTGDPEFMDPGRFVTPGLHNALEASVAGFSVDGQGTRPIRFTDLVLTGGTVLAKVTLQANTALGTGTANSDFVNQSVLALHYPIDFHLPAVERIIYEPFCDACSVNNNGTITTHTYTGALPITWRDIVLLSVPAGTASATIELCFAIIDVPNTNADSATKQMP